MRSGTLLPAGSDAVRAARQAALLFLLSGLSSFASLPTHPDYATSLTAIGVADLACGAAAWLLPWDRCPARATALLALPALAVTGASTWAFGGFAAATGPFFILLFAWLGLHHPTRVVLLCAAPATVAYVAPLVAAGASARTVSTVVVVLPVAVAVGLAIATQVRTVRDQRDRATRAEGWRSALMATLAHDVRGPLTAVHGTLMMLQETPDLTSAQRGRMVEVALRQTTRLTRLAAGLLDLERVEHGRLRLDRRPTDVAEAAAEAARLAAPGVEVDVRVDPGLRVEADPDRLEQILVNLVANATRHGAPPVELGAGCADGTVRIWVRDHGPGVPEHRLPSLFDRLGGDADHPDSVGLGMWIARVLAEAHGGLITYEPADPGARFVVHLPSGDRASVAGSG